MLNKTVSTRDIHRDAEIYFTSLLVLIATDNASMRPKALSIFNAYMSAIKRDYQALNSGLGDQRYAR